MQFQFYCLKNSFYFIILMKLVSLQQKLCKENVSMKMIYYYNEDRNFENLYLIYVKYHLNLFKWFSNPWIPLLYSWINMTHWAIGMATFYCMTWLIFNCCQPHMNIWRCIVKMQYFYGLVLFIKCQFVIVVEKFKLASCT